MDKLKLKNIYDILTKCLEDFYDGSYDYKNGSNAKIRNSGERKMNNAISLSQSWIERNEDVYKIASGGEKNVSDFSRAIHLEETFRPSYFGRDMTEILEKIKNYIEKE